MGTRFWTWRWVLALGCLGLLACSDDASPPPDHGGAVDAAPEAAPGEGGAPDLEADTSYQEDAPQLDGPAVDVALLPDGPTSDLVVPDAKVTPDAAQVCTYNHTGNSTLAGSAATALNKLVVLGWQLSAYTHGVDDHTALLQDSTGAYKLLAHTTCYLLAASVTSAVAAGAKVIGFAANKSTVVWLQKGTTYSCRESSAYATLAATVTTDVAAGWQVHSFPHASEPHAAWLSKGGTYVIHASTIGSSLETTVNKDLAQGWKVEALLANQNHTVWLTKGTALKVVSTNVASVAESSVNATVTAGWSVLTFAHADSNWAAWMAKGGSYKLHSASFSGQGLEAPVNKDVAVGYQPAAFLANKEYSLWVNRFCP